MTDYQKLLRTYRAQVEKAIKHLEFSHKLVQKLRASVDKLSDDDLLKWEGLTARFGRASDLFVSKYLRTRALEQDPSFQGTHRDLLNFAEKMGWIDSAKTWLEIRELRNRGAHEYVEEELEKIYKSILTLTPTVLDSLKKA